MIERMSFMQQDQQMENHIDLYKLLKNADQLAYTRAFDAAKNKANVWINSYQNVEPIIQHLVSPSTKVVKSLKRC